MKRVLVLAMLALACDDPTYQDVIPPPQYQPLTTRNAVLHNLELAYNQRNITKLDELLDENFTFFPSASDVNSGLPPQWDRTEEITLNTRLFATTKQPSDPWPLCTDINLDVQLEDLQWVVVPASGETWYTTTTFYDFTIKVEPDTRFIPVSGAKSQFTVRNAGTDDAPQWRLVEWHDLGSGNLAAARASAGTEESTWGKVKSLYRE